MIINVTYDSSVLNLSPTLRADYQAAVSTAVNYYESLITNPITVNISFGYGEVGGQTIGGGAVSASAQTVVSETRLFSMGDRASQVRLSDMGAVPTNDWVALCRNGKGTENS